MATEIGNEDEYSRQVSPIMQDLQNHYQVKLIVSNADENPRIQVGTNIISNLPADVNRATRNENTNEPNH